MAAGGANDVVGNILTWRQEADSDPPVEWTYTYDAADQLLTADRWSTGSTPAVLKRYAYAYDVAGNRTSEQIDDSVVESVYDNLNRLVQQRPGGTLRFAGTVSEPATVTIQGRPAGQSAASDCKEIKHVNENCVNRELVIGKLTGLWFPGNDCNTIAGDILTKCGPVPCKCPNPPPR